MSLAEEWDAGGLSTQGGCLSSKAAANRNRLQPPEHRCAFATSLASAQAGSLCVLKNHRGLTEPSIAVLDPETHDRSLSDTRVNPSSVAAIVRCNTDRLGQYFQGSPMLPGAFACAMLFSKLKYDGNSTSCGVPSPTQLPCWSKSKISD